VAFAGYGVSAISRVAMLPASGFAAITGVVALDRLGKGLRTGPRDALIADASEPTELGRNFGVHRAMDTAGALIGPLVAFAILAAIPLGLGGYRSVFVFSAAVAVVGLAVLVVAVPGRRRAAAEPTIKRAKPPRTRVRWADLTNPRMRRLLLGAGLLGLLTIGDGFIYLVLAGSGTFGASYFPLLLVGTNAVYLLLAIPLGRLADRIGRTRVFVAGYAVLASAYVLAAAQLGGPVWVLSVLALLGVFYAATDGILAAMASRCVPETSRASGIAAAQTVVALSRFGASVGFGLMWQLSGRPVAMGAMAIALIAVLPVAAWLLRSDKHVARAAK
jgi:MFS family permease